MSRRRRIATVLAATIVAVLGPLGAASVAGSCRFWGSTCPTGAEIALHRTLATAALMTVLGLASTGMVAMQPRPGSSRLLLGLSGVLTVLAMLPYDTGRDWRGITLSITTVAISIALVVVGIRRLRRGWPCGGSIRVSATPGPTGRRGRRGR